MPAAEKAIPVPAARENRLATGVLGAFGFAALTAWGAHTTIVVPLPPDGVPLSLQSLFVILAALGLGPRYGALSMLIYIIAGAVGLQVFADGGAGIAVLLGYTGGYLVGFLACQPVVGLIVRRPDGSVRGWGALILAVIAANVIIFGIGVPWLKVALGYTWMRAIEGGFVPFILPMIIKGVLAVIFGRLAAPWAARRFW
ncbi:MAG: biotin transporter BioY [Planctomycetota bacterium]